MKKIIITIALIFVIAGIAIGATGLAMINFDFTKLDNTTYETKTHEITDEVSSIQIDVETANVKLIPSEDGSCKVVCYESEKRPHTVRVENGVLKVKSDESNKLVFSLNFKTPSVTLYLPVKEYEAISVDTDTGDVTSESALSFGRASVECDTGEIAWASPVAGALRIGSDTGRISVADIAVGSLGIEADTGRIEVLRVSALGSIEVDSDTGRVTVSEVSCTALKIDSDTGKVTVNHPRIDTEMRIECSTGDVEFTDCDAASICVKTSTGDVTGTLRSEMIVYAKSNTGKISIPKFTSGGTCEVTTSTGSITIDLEGEH